MSAPLRGGRYRLVTKIPEADADGAAVLDLAPGSEIVQVGWTDAGQMRVLVLEPLFGAPPLVEGAKPAPKRAPLRMTLEG